MSHWTLRVFALLAFVSPPLANEAEAGLTGQAGSALASFGGWLPAQSAQYAGECWYDDGWNGSGWYTCGNQWNNGGGWIAPVVPFVAPAIRRHDHHRHGTAGGHHWVPHNPYRAAKPFEGPAPRAPRPSAGLNGAAPSFGAGSGFPRFGHGGFQVSPRLHGGAPTAPGGGGFHGLARGGLVYGGVAGPHVRAPGSPRFGGVTGNVHGGAIGRPHIGVPAMPGVGAGFHGSAPRIGVPRIGAPAPPGVTRSGGFHGFGAGIGTPRAGAAASPGLTGGVHGFGGGIGTSRAGAPASPGIGGGSRGAGGGIGGFRGGGAFSPGGQAGGHR